MNDICGCFQATTCATTRWVGCLVSTTVVTKWSKDATGSNNAKMAPMKWAVRVTSIV